MHEPRAKALLLCWSLARSALALRLTVEKPGVPERQNYVTSSECTGNGSIPMVFEHVLSVRREEGGLGAPLYVNGTPWCEYNPIASHDPASGNASEATTALGNSTNASQATNAFNNSVALVMIGQPFRAKNFVTGMRSSCVEGTVEVQEILSRNHMKMLVLPIERELGMKVDVFLTSSECADQSPMGTRHQVPSVNGLDRNGSNMDLLRNWYTPQRVQGIVQTSAELHMNARISEAMKYVGRHMQKNLGMYDYFIFMRYDLFLDRPFLTTMGDSEWQARNGNTDIHRGLSYFGTAHDFAFFFPSEMWGCMLNFFQGCVDHTEIGQKLNDERRRREGCFNFGPVDFMWHGGYGLADFFTMFDRELLMRAHWLTVPRDARLYVTGASSVDEHGREHRCMGRTFFPPKSSIKDRLVPSYVHAR